MLYYFACLGSLASTPTADSDITVVTLSFSALAPFLFYLYFSLAI